MILLENQAVWEKYIIGYYPSEDEDGYDGVHNGGEILKPNTPDWIKRAKQLFDTKKYDKFFSLLSEHSVA